MNELLAEVRANPGNYRSSYSARMMEALMGVVVDTPHRR